VCIHHLVVDGVSWRILLEDLQIAYRSRVARERVRLARKTTSFLAWARWLEGYARSAAVAGERAFWDAQVQRAPRPLPRDGDGPNDIDASRTLSVRLTAVETRRLLQGPGASRAQVHEVTLAAVAYVIARWNGSDAVLVDVESHGRADLDPAIDVTRTVGWFTALYPLLIDTPRGEHPEHVLARVCHLVRTTPSFGVGYGLLTSGTDDPEAAIARARPRAEISFNYLGQFRRSPDDAAWLTPATEGAGSPQAAGHRRPYVIDVMASIDRERLEMSWTYSTHLHAASTIHMLASQVLAVLRSIESVPERAEAVDAPLSVTADEWGAILAQTTAFTGEGA
jgi:non-ribosomal peptide synthase protein (TIGR01720 family)